MKFLKALFVFLLLSTTSCTSIQVVSDYDTRTNFKEYTTFAFYKTGIDKAAISDIDKRRIMRALEAAFVAKGMRKSANPDVLVSLFTQSKKKVVLNEYYHGRFYHPYQPVSISKYIEGTLFIDVIDVVKKEVVWQGIGKGVLHAKTGKRKEKRIQEFVTEIMKKYPLASSVE